MTSRFCLYSLVLASTLLVPACQSHSPAEFIELPALFTDHMVLKLLHYLIQFTKVGKAFELFHEFNRF